MIQRKTYCPKDSDFNDYFSHQIGTGFGDIRIVRAPRYQRGYGFGSFFSRLALPIIKYLGKEALNKGVSIGKRVVQDPAIQQAFKDSVRDLADKGISKLRENVKIQEGTGHKRLYKRKKKTVTKKSPHKVKKSTPKRVTTKKVVTKRKTIRKPKDIFR